MKKGPNNEQQSAPERAKRPSHTIYAVSGDGEGAIWTKIGVTFAHRDGKGFSQIMNAVPMNSRVVLREYKERNADNRAGGQQ